MRTFSIRPDEADLKAVKACQLRIIYVFCYREPLEPLFKLHSTSLMWTFYSMSAVNSDICSRKKQGTEIVGDQYYLKLKTIDSLYLGVLDPNFWRIPGLYVLKMRVKYILNVSMNGPVI